MPLPTSIFAQHARCHDGTSPGAWPAKRVRFQVMKLMLLGVVRK